MAVSWDSCSWSSPTQRKLLLCQEAWAERQVKMYHEHPLKILRYSAKNIWLLVFPLIRGVYTYHFDKNWLYSWIKGAWFDIAVLGAIILFGFIRWYFSRIDFTSEELVHRDGVFVRVNTYIPFKNISSATIECPLFMLPFNAVRFRCDTRAGIFKTVDLYKTFMHRTLKVWERKHLLIV